MNKGVVMEKHRKFMVVLTAAGHFQKATLIEEAQIGEEVEFEPVFQKTRKSALAQLNKVPIKMLAAACMLIAVIGSIYFTMDKKDQTYAYVHIDINPSIELRVDKSLAVQAFKPLNKDAKKLIKLLDVDEGEHLDVVMKEIMKTSLENGLDKNGKHMFVGVSYPEDVKKDLSVVGHINAMMEEEGAGWKVAAFEVPEKIRHLAKKENKSMISLIAMDAEKSAEFELSDELTNKVVTKEEQEMIRSFYYPKNKEKKVETDTPTLDEPKVKSVKEQVDQTNNQEKSKGTSTSKKKESTNEKSTNSVKSSSNREPKNPQSSNQKTEKVEQQTNNQNDNRNHNVNNHTENQKSSSYNQDKQKQQNYNNEQKNNQSYDYQQKQENYQQKNEYYKNKNEQYKNKQYEYKNKDEYRYQNKNDDDDDEDDD